SLEIYCARVLRSLRPRESLCGRAGGDPGRQDLALLRGDLGDVARRHGVRADGVDLDQARVAADILRIVEHDAVGGRMDAGPERLLSGAHSAAWQHPIFGRPGVA